MSALTIAQATPRDIDGRQNTTSTKSNIALKATLSRFMKGVSSTPKIPIGTIAKTTMAIPLRGSRS